jgi:hypothetical protein
MRAKPEHEVVYEDLRKLIAKHADKVTAAEILAIAANMIGKIVALQDQRTMTRERALELVVHNIEEGNRQVIEELQRSQGVA